MKKKSQKANEEIMDNLRDYVWSSLQEWSATVDITKPEGQSYLLTILSETLGVMIADMSDSVEHGEQCADKVKGQIMSYIKIKFKEKK